MKFFLPDWDDRVDPGYDFSTDRHTLRRNVHRDDLYAHEVIQEAVYDGILVSRMSLGESGPKRQLIDRIGMRAYLRLPADIRLLGDCGAFGYMRDPEPRFETAELVSYYSRLGFDFGVSMDHAIVPEFKEFREQRYELSLRNAQEFLRWYKAGNHTFVPIGAIQGWSTESYVEAAQAVVEMGYDYIAIGGLARSRSTTILSIVKAVRDAIPNDTSIHTFGIARISLLPTFLEMGIASTDSASPMRQAWLSATDNYHTLDRNYIALRIPAADEERTVSDSLVARSDARLGELRRAEKEALQAVYEYDKRELNLRSTLKALMMYDKLLAHRRENQDSSERERRYRDTLADRPWSRCKCSVCQELGIDVVIFRGNNRNKRRGFHNLYVLQKRLATIPASST
jgi:hypothetical protein